MYIYTMKRLEYVRVHHACLAKYLVTNANTAAIKAGLLQRTA